MAAKVARCIRCNRRHRGQATWFAQIGADGVPHACCPNCMSAEDKLEAQTAARAGSFVLSTPSAHGVEVANHKPVGGGAR